LVDPKPGRSGARSILIVRPLPQSHITGFRDQIKKQKNKPSHNKKQKSP